MLTCRQLHASLLPLHAEPGSRAKQITLRTSDYSQCGPFSHHSGPSEYQG